MHVNVCINIENCVSFGEVKESAHMAAQNSSNRFMFIALPKLIKINQLGFFRFYCCENWHDINCYLV